MNYNVKTINIFDRQIKRLAKKFPSLKNELKNLINSLKEDPKLGTHIGNDCYKIRLAIASKGKGKSGGARVITHIVFTDDTVYLLSIYDKSEIDNLTDKEILSFIKEIDN